MTIQVSQAPLDLGRGSTPESDWGKKDDEDERMFARRCLLMAHSMYKPKSVKRGFHR